MRNIAAFALLLAFTATPAAAVDFPQRKPGLWQISMTSEGRNMPPQVSKQCTDAATDKDMITMTAGNKSDCSPMDIKQVGATYVTDMTCKFGETSMTSHAVVSGDFNSAYNVNIESKMSGQAMPGGPPGGVSRMTIAAKWLGPCEAGQKPGDIILSNGMKMNIHDAPRGRPGMGAPPRGMPPQGVPQR